MKNRKMDTFFSSSDREHLGLTFDDVLLRPAHSEGDFNVANLESKFSTNVGVKIPLISAAMDTVTDGRLAIALAMNGGLGVIHRNFDPEEQSKQVRKVKMHLNGKISQPVTVQSKDTIDDVLLMCKDRGFDFRSFPVLGQVGELVGMLTGNDIGWRSIDKYVVSSLMTKDVVTSGPGTTLIEAEAIMRRHKVKVLPLVDGDKKVVGLYLWSDVDRILHHSNEMHNTDAEGRLMVGAAVGTGPDTLDRVKLLVQRNVDVIVIDSAHGDSKPVLTMLEKIKQEFPNLDVVVGNVSEEDSATLLVEAGADGIKVGQGAGTICKTRVVTGAGTPQVTAIYNCAWAVRHSKRPETPICGDGGITSPGCLAKAIAAGAHTVMLGKIFAGTDEAPGEKVTSRGGTYKRYRGMGSLEAMMANRSSRERYGELQTGKSLILAEGEPALVPYEGSLSEVVHRHIEGLKRGMGTSGGAMSISDFHAIARFRRITQAGLRESHPHSVILESGT